MTASAAAILHLQRTVGNRATRRVLARDERQNAPLPRPPGGPAYAVPQGKLSAADRAILEAGAADRVDQAFTAFGDAIDAVAASFKAHDKAKAEILAATMSVFFGIAAPFVGQRLAASGSKLADAADWLGSALSKEGAAAVKAVSSSDVIKESFKVVGTVGTSVIKLDPSALFGESDVQVFARKLKTEFHVGAQAITDALAKHTLTDEQLVTTWLAFDVKFTNEVVYVEALERMFADFKQFVRPIGHETISSGGMTGGGGAHSQTVHAAWANQPGGGRRLVLIDDQESATGLYTSETRKVTEIPRDLVPYAVEKTVREFGAVETLNMPWDPPDPESEPETIRRNLEQIEAIRREAEKAAGLRSQKNIDDFVKTHRDWQLGTK